MPTASNQHRAWYWSALANLGTDLRVGRSRPRLRGPCGGPAHHLEAAGEHPPDYPARPRPQAVGAGWTVDNPRYFELESCDCDPRKSIGGIWNSASAVAGTSGSSSRMRLDALPHRNWHRQISLQHIDFTAAIQGARTMLIAPRRTVGIYAAEAPSKRHPKGACVASLRLFTMNRHGVHEHRNTHEHRSANARGPGHRPHDPVGACETAAER